MPKHFLFLQLESKMFCWISILKKTKKTGFFVHLGHQMGSKSLRTTVFWLAATPSETPSQMPSETPSEMPSETPSETPGETPVATPVVTPVVTPVATVEILEHYPNIYVPNRRRGEGDPRLCEKYPKYALFFIESMLTAGAARPKMSSWTINSLIHLNVKNYSSGFTHKDG